MPLKVVPHLGFLPGSEHGRLLNRFMVSVPDVAVIDDSLRIPRQVNPVVQRLLELDAAPRLDGFGPEAANPVIINPAIK